MAAMLDGHRFPQEHFWGCLGIMRLARRHGADRMEAAARRALHYGQVSYRSIDRILRRNADRPPLEGEAERPGARPSEHGNLRGGGYYRDADRSGRNGGGPCRCSRPWSSSTGCA